MRLTAADFRFLSAWIQGVDVQAAWDRYMRHRGMDDPRRMRTTVRSMLDQLAAVSKRQGDLETASLLRRDSARIKLPALVPSRPSQPTAHAGPAQRRLPTLEQFAAEVEDAGFYSEAELIELLEQRYGGVASPRPGSLQAIRDRDSAELRAQKRRGRLIQRQLDALRRLEVLAATAPAPADDLSGWLDQETVKRLGRVGVQRISELMFYIRLHGYRWYRNVPRIGEGGAVRLVSWLRQHEEAIGAVPINALAPLRQLDVAAVTPGMTSGVVPIERLRLPSTLSGAEGSNRAPPGRCSARARDDHAAVMEWLEQRRPAGAAGNAHTYRAYRKEAERFLLWAVFERRKALSDLDPADCANYSGFLSAPGPAWIRAKSVPRWSEHWRPFEGPLAPASRRAALTIASMLCAWLVEVRYLESNPWTRVTRQSDPLHVHPLRCLTDAQWDRVSSWLQSLPENPANARLRVLFGLALATGMRAEELASARAGWLRQDAEEEGTPAWSLRVVGRGAREREIPLTRRVAGLLAGHLQAKGLAPSLAMLDPQTPLVSALRDPLRPMNATRVYELMKQALRACADEAQGDDPRAAARIRQASPHWLRHTHGRKFIEGGGDRQVLRLNLGHASDATTTIYELSGPKRRRREVEKVFG